MNIKPKTAVLAILTLSTVGLATAKAPEIDPARIDSMVAEVLRQADQHPNQTAKPDGQAIRKDVVTRLQTLEILKNEAIKAGLDKDAEVQNQFKNVEAEFYANQYAAYLERQTAVDDAELRHFYDQQTRIIKLQQVSFASADEVRAAQELLLKGLSFEELMKRYPNPEQEFDGFISPQQLPPQLATAFANMNRGDVTHEPVVIGNRFYLFKLSAVERDPKAKPFELVRNQLAQAVKRQKVNNQIERILKENGINP